MSRNPGQSRNRLVGHLPGQEADNPVRAAQCVEAGMRRPLVSVLCLLAAKARPTVMAPGLTGLGVRP